MKTENQLSKIKPADRLASVSEYYFSKKQGFSVKESRGKP